MKFKTGNRVPCAACKSQRRKCSSDCQLAPFFPSDQPKRFEDARKLFGVRNILKNLKRVGDDPFIQSETMWAITCESSLRAEDKVHGATGEIVKLICEIQRTRQEIESVNAQIGMHKICNYDGGVMDCFGSFVGDFNYGGISDELKVFGAGQNFNACVGETSTKSEQPSVESPLKMKSELEPLLVQNMEMEIKDELKSAEDFFCLTNNVKTEEEIFPLSEDF